jgi:hypothetical protein
MGAALGLPVYCVDDVQWQPGWARTPPAEVARQHAAWLAEPRWIIDGWGGWENIETRFAAADTIVFVDLPLVTHYWWAAKRQIQCALGRNDGWPPPGCRALPITWRLFQVLWMVHHTLRPQLVTMLPRFAGTASIVHLRSPSALRAFEYTVTAPAAGRLPGDSPRQPG